MNNFFNPVRFSRLFVKHTAEHYRTYLMSAAVLAGVMVLGGSFIFFMIPEPPDPGFQTAIFVMLMLIAGTIFTSTVFSDYGVKSKAIPALTLPASAFEKYLIGWLYSGPIFMLVYTSIFYLLLYGLGSTKHWPGKHFEVFSLHQPDGYMLIVIYSMLHAISIFGAIFFEKLHFIKTAFAFFIAYAVAMLCNTLFITLITGQAVKPALVFGYMNFEKDGKYYGIASIGVEDGYIMVVMVLAAILVWVAAYYRLKEKQV